MTTYKINPFTQISFSPYYMHLSSPLHYFWEPLSTSVKWKIPKNQENGRHPTDMKGRILLNPKYSHGSMSTCKWGWESWPGGGHPRKLQKNTIWKTNGLRKSAGNQCSSRSFLQQRLFPIFPHNPVLMWGKSYLLLPVFVKEVLPPSRSALM